jgi:hypothetical protein
VNRYPLRVEATRDESLSRWLWLVKWLLLIPHILVLLVLWVGFAVLTLVSYLAVLVTGRYPHAIRAYCLGVLRWSWRVNYYGYQALGTDRYPPFTLADVPDYPARLELDDTPPPPRWLPLVAWLLALPHIALLGALTGAASWQFDSSDHSTTSAPVGVVAIGILIAGLALLFTGRYPRGLDDLMVGVARWNLRVTAYLALLSPRYPPFRLDQGDSEPDGDPIGPDTRTARTDSSPAGSIVALVAGVLLLLPATGAVAGGAAALALSGSRDSSGWVTSPLVHVQSSTAAVTAEDITVEAGDLWTRNLADLGGLRLSATGAAGQDVFVGIAPQAAVDTWLAGAARDRVTGMASGDVRYARRGGAVQSVTSPAAQTFWLATATGTGTANLSWKVVNGDFAVVLANVDGSAGVSADVRASTQVPNLTGLGGALLGTGILLGLLALTLIVIGGIGLGRRHGGPPPLRAEPAPAAPQTPPLLAEPAPAAPQDAAPKTATGD